MKPDHRQILIMDILHESGKVSVKDLVSRLDVSAETIRRDLTLLRDTGKLQKTYGGAVSPRIPGEGPFIQRMNENRTAKQMIAKKGCSLILPGDILFIDTGSTTLAFAEELVGIDELTIITNSAGIANTMGANSTSRVFLVGGQHNIDNNETTGPMAISQLSQFWVNHAILTIGGIHEKTGICDFNINESLIARAMIEQADNTVVLADPSKMDKIAPFKVASLNQIGHLICYKKPENPLSEALEQANVCIISAI